MSYPLWHLRKKRTFKTNTTSSFSSPQYASPEQLHPTPHTPYTPASDMYSLGIILFELLQPFTTQMERAQHLARLRSAVFPPGFEKRFPVESAWIRGMIDRQPVRRPGAADLLVWMDEPRGGGSTMVMVASPMDEVTPNGAEYFAKIPTTPMTTTATTTVPSSSPGLRDTFAPLIQDDGLAEQNRALRMRVEELEKRLAGMGVDV